MHYGSSIGTGVRASNGDHRENDTDRSFHSAYFKTTISQFLTLSENDLRSLFSQINQSNFVRQASSVYRRTHLLGSNFQVCFLFKTIQQNTGNTFTLSTPSYRRPYLHSVTLCGETMGFLCKAKALQRYTYRNIAITIFRSRQNIEVGPPQTAADV